MKNLRVLIADEQTMVFEGLRKILEEHCEVVGGVEDGLALVESVGHAQPDVVILEIGLPLLNGLEAGRQIKLLDRKSVV